MTTSPATTKVIKPGKSENPFLLFTGNRKQSKSHVKLTDTEWVTSLLVGAAGTVIFILLYFFFSGKLG